jgi:chemotaxis receptor (MCP) glutamine deamidase CheD
MRSHLSLGPAQEVGGMNHYLLPEGLSDGPNRLRYGNVANPELLKQVLALGCEIRNLQAKIFGGSSAFGCRPVAVVGSRNVELAESFLRSAGIPVVEREVSGKHGRRLFFQIFDGVTKDQEF